MSTLAAITRYTHNYHTTLFGMRVVFMHHQYRALSIRLSIAITYLCLPSVSAQHATINFITQEPDEKHLLTDNITIILLLVR